MRRAVFACLLTVALAPFVVTHARAEGKRPTPEAVRSAQAHYKKAHELYLTGNYPEAIGELETARALDPYATDLVYNLGLIHEKAGHIDDALRFYHLYLEMDLSPDERAKGESIIRRLAGARTHVPPSATVTVTVTTTQTVPPPPAHGRFDGLTFFSGFLAVAGYGVGTGLGIAALETRPASGQTTTSGLTYQQLQAQADQAHMLAIGADIAFLSGIVFTGLTLGLYFGRTKKADAAAGTAHVSIAPSPTGATLIFGGSF